MVQPTPTVSAIMPIHQAEASVERAVRSVLARSERSLELIVVDDGSTDAGPERVAAIDDPRARLVRRANAGCGAARNAALARGRLVAFR